MNFTNFFLKSFRILLLPFAIIYGLGVMLRNWLYNKKILRSARFNLPIICVGNLAVGGTGKSPMVEYLVKLLQSRFKIATLSRGYKRKTKGYALAGTETTALEIGDEPMQFHLKFPDLAVAVGERRIEAIPQLLHDRPGTEAILLDDAFQHREVTAGLNILLTDYHNLFTRDFFLPTGDLRDQRSSYKRADILVVTKCPAELSVEEKNEVLDELQPRSGQQIFFTTIRYGIPFHIFHQEKKEILPHEEILLVCGIANPRPLQEYLSDKTKAYELMTYNDHHIFTIDDLKDIRNRFDQLPARNKFILTTEKDAVRLIKFRTELELMPLYVIGIEPGFLFDEGKYFDDRVVDFIGNFALQENEQSAI